MRKSCRLNIQWWIFFNEIWDEKNYQCIELSIIDLWIYNDFCFNIKLNQDNHYWKIENENLFVNHVTPSGIRVIPSI